MGIRTRLVRIERKLALIANPPLTDGQKASMLNQRRKIEALTKVVSTMRKDHAKQFINEYSGYYRAKQAGDGREAFLSMSAITRNISWQLTRHMIGLNEPLAMPPAYATFLNKCAEAGISDSDKFCCDDCNAWHPVQRVEANAGNHYLGLQCFVDACQICGGQLTPGVTKASQRGSH